MQHHRLQDPALENRLPGLFDAMADAAPDDPGIGDAVLGRARRRRARRLAGGVAGTATGMAAAVALAVGGIPTLPDFGTRGSSQVAAERAAPKGFVVGPYELTVLPEGLLPVPSSGDQEVGTFQDKVDKSVTWAGTGQEFTEGGREVDPPEKFEGKARSLEVGVFQPVAGGVAAAQRAWERESQRERKGLEPGETMVEDTMLGRPAYLKTRSGSSNRIGLFSAPDAETGLTVFVEGFSLTEAEVRAVADGLRLIPGAPALTPKPTPTPAPSRTYAPITSGVVPAADSSWPQLEPQHPPIEVHQAVLDTYKGPADDAFRNPEREYQWVLTTSGVLKRQIGDEAAFDEYEDDTPVYVAQVPKARPDGTKVAAPAARQFMRILIPLPKGETRVANFYTGTGDRWLDLSGLGTAHRASADFKP